MQTLDGIHLIIFDQDETLVDNGFKSNGCAFLWALEGDRGLQSAFLNIILTDSNWRNYNRFEMFRRILVKADRWKEGEVSDNESWKSRQEIIKLVHTFSEIVQTESIRCGLYPKVQETLALLQQSGFDMYIVSGAGHEDVVAIARVLGTAEFMNGIYGFGWRSSAGKGVGKQDAAKHILKYNPNIDVTAQVVVVGDGASDQKLAQHIGCHFVGIPRDLTNDWGEVVDLSGIEFRKEMICIDNVSRLPELFGLV